MTAVLISIRPKWCGLIVNGTKTIEVRKTKPKLKPPFKCYIYETKAKTDSELDWYNLSFIEYGVGVNGDQYATGVNYDIRNCKVIGEFVCNNIDEIVPDYNPITKKFLYGNEVDTAPTCLSEKQLQDYGQGKPLYFWHISELKIYNIPKELWDFRFECPKSNIDTCWGCRFEVLNSWDNETACGAWLNRPPQSWCYVEALT